MEQQKKPFENKVETEIWRMKEHSSENQAIMEKSRKHCYLSHTNLLAKQTPFQRNAAHFFLQLSLWLMIFTFFSNRNNHFPFYSTNSNYILIIETNVLAQYPYELRITNDRVACAWGPHLLDKKQ